MDRMRPHHHIRHNIMMDREFLFGELKASEAALSSWLDVAKRLGSDCAKGLSDADVQRRRKTWGYNELQISKEEPLWKKYIGQV